MHGMPHAAHFTGDIGLIDQQLLSKRFCPIVFSFLVEL